MPTRAVVLLACLFLFASCARQPAPPPLPRGDTANAVPLADFLRDYRLRLLSDPATGRYEFEAGAERFTLYAGSDMLRLPAGLVTIPTPPFYDSGTFWIPRPTIERLPASIRNRAHLRAKRLVILDPGHGGTDEGAVAHGMRESDLNLDVALRTRAYLQARGIPVQLTREDDSFLSLQARADMANRRPDSLFVSIHFNAFRDASVQGLETFLLTPANRNPVRVRNLAARVPLQYNGTRLDPAEAMPHIRRMEDAAYREGERLAATLHDRLLRELGEVDRGIRHANFQVLRDTVLAPAVLLELGYMTHAPTARRLRDAHYRDRIARTLAHAIQDHLHDSR